MVINSILGNRKVIKSMLNSKKVEIMSSRLERWLFDKFGHMAIRIFGWTLTLPSRHTNRVIFSYLKNEKGKFLEVGCSYGTYSFALAAINSSNQLVSIDINEDSLNVAKGIKESLKTENISFICEDILNSGFPDVSFDVVVMGEVLEHITDDMRAIREINRILRRGGSFVISVPYSEIVEEHTTPVEAFRHKSGENLTDDSLFRGCYHVRSGYNEERITSLLENNGFNVVNISKVCLPKILLGKTLSGAISVFFFPLIYPISFITTLFSRNCIKIVLKAKKK